ncbi:1,4-dihydroxy-6-naphthoate synthase [Candidatus Poribacteria bacterium]|nr:1,4-dihydroxy-6-naphthoate synthase [Candidatus Poribacteria bacterium]
MDNDLYCKIYVDTDMTHDQLVKTVARLLAGTVEMNTVAMSNCEIDVRKNEDFDDIRRKEFPDGFLYFRYYMDVEVLTGQQRESQVELISNLLKHLWSLGFPAIASCDFEAELPQRGGYQSRSVPWMT